MKTPDYYLDEVAKVKLHTDSFSEAIELLWRNEDVEWGLKNINEVVKEAMLRHSKEACEEQKKLCADVADIYFDDAGWMDSYINPDFVSVDKQSIINAKSPIE